MSAMKTFIAQLDTKALKASCDNNNGVFKQTVDGKEYSLTHGVHFWYNARDKMNM